MKARMLSKQGSYSKAIQTLESLLSDDNIDKLTVNNLLAECYIHTGKYERAYKLLKSIFKQKEKGDEIAFLANYIYSCIETDRKMEALEMIFDAIQKYSFGILEHLSAIHRRINWKTETEISNESMIDLGDLARDFFILNTHYN
jgi:lipopolysaccharide biosynthesis regulator YciM